MILKRKVKKNGKWLTFSVVLSPNHSLLKIKNKCVLVLYNMTMAIIITKERPLSFLPLQIRGRLHKTWNI